MKLVEWLRLILAPLASAGRSAEGVAELFALLGWKVPQIDSFPIAAVAEALADVSAAMAALDSVAEEEPTSLRDILYALETTAEAVEAVVDLAGVLQNAQAPGLADAGKALVTGIGLAVLYDTYPAAYWALVTIGAIRRGEEIEELPPVTVPPDRVLREPYAQDLVVGGKLSDFIRSPRAALAAEYLPAGGITSDAAASAVAARLFPRLARLAGVLGLDAKYGALPGAALPPLADRMMAIGFAPAFSNLRFGAAIGISSPESGDLGTVAVPYGGATSSVSIPGWRVDVSLTGDVGAVAFKDGNVQLLGSPDAALGIAVQSTNKTPLDLLNLGALRVSAERVRLEISIAADEIKTSLQLAALRAELGGGEQDPIFEAILPPRFGGHSDVTLGWSTRSGLSFHAGDGVGLSLPVRGSFGPVTVSRISLEVRGDDDIEMALGMTTGLRIGPFALVVDSLGVSSQVNFADDGGNLGFGHLSLRLPPPTAVGVAIDTAGFVGAGFLERDADRGSYAASLHLEIMGVSASALGLLERRPGQAGVELAMVMGTRIPGGIPLGLGVMLDGIGGLLAINRAADVEHLRAGVRGGAFDGLFFPERPLTDASTAVGEFAALVSVDAGAPRSRPGRAARMGATAGCERGRSSPCGVARTDPCPARLISSDRRAQPYDAPNRSSIRRARCSGLRWCDVCARCFIARFKGRGIPAHRRHGVPHVVG